MCNPGSATTKQVADKLQLQKEWFTKEEFNAATVAPRSNCVLNIDKLSAIYQLQHVTAALDTAIEKLQQVR